MTITEIKSISNEKHYHIYHIIGMNQDIIVYQKKVKTKKESKHELSKAKKQAHKFDGSTFEGNLNYGYLESKQEYMTFYSQQHNKKCMGVLEK